jgi:hypothetical protein
LVLRSFILVLIFFNGKTKEHRQQKVAFQINGSKEEQEATSKREKSNKTS